MWPVCCILSVNYLTFFIFWGRSYSFNSEDVFNPRVTVIPGSLWKVCRRSIRSWKIFRLVHGGSLETFFMLINYSVGARNCEYICYQYILHVKRCTSAPICWAKLNWKFMVFRHLSNQNPKSFMLHDLHGRGPSWIVLPGSDRCFRFPPFSARFLSEIYIFQRKQH